MTTASLSTLRDLKLGGMASAYEAVLATPLDQHPEAPTNSSPASSTPSARTASVAAWTTK
ncbi:hypothetical protein [Neolewinella sp.]|uniref:hypothetical protein n=1 Tax=Neolewinella sp. TaxID=2993543 RepID=UPI003B51D611